MWPLGKCLAYLHRRCACRAVDSSAMTSRGALHGKIEMSAVIHITGFKTVSVMIV